MSNSAISGGTRQALFFDRRRIARAHPQRRRRGPRGKDEIDRERRQKWEQTCREIDEVYAAYGVRIDRAHAQSTGTVYARYSTVHQHSIADQVRAILEHALKLNVYVPRELIFFDLAVRGFKRQRDGLGQMELALRRKQARVLLLFSTSRLFRKTYRTLEFVDTMHRSIGARCIFVMSGIDTNDKKRWESILAMQAMVDQFVVTMYVANIHAAHEGLLSKRMVFGTLAYGYSGQPIDGEFTKLGRPRCRIVIDDETARIVRQVFAWYVDDGLPIAEIIRKLNADESIPLPPRAISGEWTRVAVKRILANTRYRGLWQYGVTESIYIPDADYTRQDMRTEPLKEAEIEELRIVSDDIWFAAQKRLEREGRRGGRPPKDGNRSVRPRLLNGLLICPTHNRPLYVSGPFGKSMHCPSCRRSPADTRPLFSALNRQLATEMICSKLAELVVASPELVEQVISACQLKVVSAQKPDPQLVTQLEHKLDQTVRSIDFTRRTVGATPEEQADAERTVKDLQREKSDLQSQLARLQPGAERPVRVPTREDVEQLLDELGMILADASNTQDAEQAARARRVIELLIDGVIELEQQGVPKPQRGWLRGRFRVRLMPYLVERLSGDTVAMANEGVEVVIDFKRPSATIGESERAWQLYKDGHMNLDIADELTCSRSKVTKLLQDAAARHGEKLQDGRSRRASLDRKHREQPLYQRIADEVVRMMENTQEELLLDEIAGHFGCDRNTITKAIAWWHTTRGLPVPDGRTRRKGLDRKSSKQPPGSEAA